MRRGPFIFIALLATLFCGDVSGVKVFDALDRRLVTTTVLVSNGVPSTVPPQVLLSYFDPQVEFLELGAQLITAPEKEFLEVGTSPSVETTWKLYGPDLNGKYGGLNGIGGLEAVSPYQTIFNPVISDARGNVLAQVTNGVVAWTTARSTGYGAVPGYRPVAYGNGVDLAQSCVFLGREVDVTGYHHFGERDYDPVSGQWLERDPMWNERDPNAYTFCGGDPIGYFDSDGRLGKGFYQSAEGAVTGTAGLLWNIGGSIGYGVTSIFSPNTAADIYGNQMQGLENTGAGLEYLGSQALQGNFGTVGTALTGGANQSGFYRAGYAAGSIGLIFAGGELGAAGDVGNLGTVGDVSSTVSQTATAASSVWDLNPFARGQSIEQTLGANLPGNFPTIDNFNFANGTATSIKSINLNAASYQNPATLTSRLNGYVNSVAGFNGADWADVNIGASQITGRQLQLAIPPGSASAAQQGAINAAAARAQGMGVNFITTPVP